MLEKDTASSVLNYYAGATLRRPTLFGTHWVPSYSAYTERSGEYQAYLRTTYLGGEAAATRDLGARTAVSRGVHDGVRPHDRAAGDSLRDLQAVHAE